MDHQPGRHDDMAITVAMATWRHHHQPTPWQPRPLYLNVHDTKESPTTHFDYPGAGHHRW